ncbi:MAG: UDP-N-acetylmuramoyl-L-alanyl-D-glutamate--2,6-diaminopimelate ligase [Chloroflexi bacterium]|nr:UDP-N-acetylmuramoyl-L-alanyl-D-glutamate--2,6-diaminopimelate ligase [Dehalococcoidia bacterium]MCO5202299.1 UDP-N-acetylmuramoyl-L-alanyl-D-glutamate--2,6-diaminopimelate ligase [Chloroflexota bacterium]MCZ7575862.1 UDP-N-acetylmuramoyl-L-alanyl-D-glutamate--2,6-diaminopimelate ligase [Dehalococcoidia bacterium]
MTDAQPRTIAALLQELPAARLLRGDPTTTVDAVEHDSRRAAAGTLFVAIPGFTVDGHSFLPQVAAAGAAAAIIEAGHALPAGLDDTLALIEVPRTRPALAAAAAWFYGHPGRDMVVIGITGTDGKTTTSHLLTSVLEAAGGSVGRLGTVDTYFPGESGKVTDRMTTPEANEVQRLLRRMADAGCEFAIVESTSHGLALNRLDHVEYDIAAFTNITGDHLDFHKTFEAYREAKGLLFEALDTATHKGIAKTAVVNADDPSANYMLERSRAEPLSFGLEARDATVVAHNLVLRADGTDFRLVTPRGTAEASIQLPAVFNVMNALAAASVGLACGGGVSDIARGLGACPGVPGRMERIVQGQPFEVIVDYAHTGDAVRKVLEVLREVCRGRLIIVVGAAGERDPGRRFGVGRAAAEGADFAVFTNEDPRSEDPAAIVREIGRHAEGAGRVRGQDFVEIEDRREAIAEALRRAAPGDIVVVAGKGHEKSIVYGTESRPWDDRDVAREELTRIGYRRP